MRTRKNYFGLNSRDQLSHCINSHTKLPPAANSTDDCSRNASAFLICLSCQSTAAAAAPQASLHTLSENQTQANTGDEAPKKKPKTRNNSWLLPLLSIDDQNILYLPHTIRSTEAFLCNRIKYNHFGIRLIQTLESYSFQA